MGDGVSVALGVVVGVALGVAVEVALGVTVGVALEVGVCVREGAALGVALWKSVAVLLGITTVGVGRQLQALISTAQISSRKTGYRVTLRNPELISRGSA